jgi:hypothetical protein
MVTTCGPGQGALRAARHVAASELAEADARAVQTVTLPWHGDPARAQLHTHALVATHSASAGLAFDTAAAAAWASGRGGERGGRGTVAAAAALSVIGATLASIAGARAREGEGQGEGQHMAVCAPKYGLPSIGPYQLLKVLGDGGYGRVYLGEHDATGKN